MEAGKMKFLYVMLNCNVPQLHNEIQVRRTMLEGKNCKDKSFYASRCYLL
jgi:hypothetical protein